MKVLHNQRIMFVMEFRYNKLKNGSSVTTPICHLVTDRSTDAIETASVISNKGTKPCVDVYSWSFSGGIELRYSFLMGQCDPFVTDMNRGYASDVKLASMFGILETLFANGFECLTRVETTEEVHEPLTTMPVNKFSDHR